MSRCSNGKSTTSLWKQNITASLWSNAILPRVKENVISCLYPAWLLMIKKFILEKGNDILEVLLNSQSDWLAIYNVIK